MNWRRGLWRVWFVLWVLGTPLLTFLAVERGNFYWSERQDYVRAVLDHERCLSFNETLRDDPEDLVDFGGFAESARRAGARMRGELEEYDENLQARIAKRRAEVAAMAPRVCEAPSWKGSDPWVTWHVVSWTLLASTVGWWGVWFTGIWLARGFREGNPSD